MEYWVLILVALLLAALFGFIVGTGRSRTKGKFSAPPSAVPAREPCPLCGSLLAPGERIRSALFPGGADRLTHVFGCPHCYPPNDRRPRRCPVCRTPLPADGYVVARMFERRRRATPAGAAGRPRQHLHLLGCDACRASSRREARP